MERIVKTLKNNRKVTFDTGRFDDWCVYVVEADGKKLAPHDSTYFSELKEIAGHYPEGKVYNDFISIYFHTTKEIEKKVLNLIESIVLSYQTTHRQKVEQWFTVLYAGMIAEENKDKAILKKRIKRLGMHQVLALDMPAEEAAKFSFGKKWKELDKIMKEYGF